MYYRKFLTASVVCVAALLTACAGAPTVKLDQASKQSIKAVAVSSSASMPKDMFFQGPAQSIGMGVGGLIGAAIASGSSDNKVLIQHALSKNDIDVGKIVATEFSNELRASGKMPIAADGKADAEFKFEVVVYGLGQTQGFASTLYPTLGVNGSLVGNDGKVLWQRYEFVTPHNKENTIGATPEAFYKDPEMLRGAFKKAAGIVSRMLQESL